ncbi:MAG TPA: TolC family protein [Granulicella sp.]
MLRTAALACAVAFSCAPAQAQLTFSSAINLALGNSPRIKAAEADVAKAQAALSQTRDVYIPSVVIGSGVGPPPYGFPLGQPSIYNVQASSLVFNFSQRDYIRSARAALNAANYALKDARLAVAEETANTYLALDRDLQRESALREENGYSTRLVGIVQDRLDAGQDNRIDLTTAKLTDAQIHLSRLHDEDETDIDRDRLAKLTGLPSEGLTTVSSSIPAIEGPVPSSSLSGLENSPGIKAMYEQARAKQQQAFGDARYEWRPQIALGAQYSRFAYYANYSDYYSHFQQNNAEIGVQITLPIFDMVHRAKARESAADASHALHDADMQRDQFLNGRLRLRHAAEELSARVQVAELDQQLAQQQLDAMSVQLQSGSGNPNAPLMTPKDEQNARISERQKYIGLLDTTLQLRQTQISLLRQTGQLEGWVHALITASTSSATAELTRP